MGTVKMRCDEMGTKLADLLLDPASAPAEVKAHAETCDACRKELEELRATMNLLDAWKAPEPNPYFVSKATARFREEREAAPAGWPMRWVDRMRARFAYGGRAQMRPIAAMALAIVLLLGGGAYVGLSDLSQPVALSHEDAVVHDLQLMDSNAQLLDQLEALSSNSQDGD